MAAPLSTLLSASLYWSSIKHLGDNFRTHRKTFSQKKISEILRLFSADSCTLITTCSLSLAQELVTVPYEEKWYIKIYLVIPWYKFIHCSKAQSTINFPLSPFGQCTRSNLYSDHLILPGFTWSYANYSIILQK